MADNQGHIKPTAELIRQYLEGTLDDKTMHALEKQALDDPFLAEALEGYALHPADQQPALGELQSRLEKRVAAVKKVRRLDYKWLAAAAVLLLVTTGAIFFMNRPMRPAGEIAQQKNSTTSDSVAAAATPATADTAAADMAANQQVTEPAAEAEQKPVNPKKPAAPKETVQAPAFAKDDVADERARLDQKQPAPVVAAAPPPPPPAAKRMTLSGSYTEKVDTIRIGKYAADSTTYAFQRAPGKVEGVISGAPNKYPNHREERDERLISGVVVDAETGRRLPGVSVVESGTNKGAITDTAGNFALRVDPANKVKLDFQYIGYEKTNVEVAANNNQLNIKLPANNQALNETVIVVGRAKDVAYGNNDRIMIRGASRLPAGKTLAPHPSVSMFAYSNYLESRRKLVIPGLLENKSGQVRLSFTVMPDSTLKNFNVLESMGDVANKAAIRIIREGPKWVPASGGKKAKAEVTVPLLLLKQE
ncbi:hypothetical protein EGT74_09835 [Chitinophaga lutea]|uniref:TonB C-terminal domain-containing protein n=1 Tax=Chitinophaga lutea TaxID=2488634 RepID=A0A3N4PYJ0_9BACT|nr:carboxypeptidase-like regulatory domain-containing protein [Chitinophaga lutea]RPE13792.1 hypothetical protein EGT74_09835 [Chitinophaga lutea]